jgi:hemerythrin superfamily protein
MAGTVAFDWPLLFSATTVATELLTSVREDTKMFDWMLPDTHAITILKKDHETVKSLFDDFEKSDSAARRKKIITQAVTELKAHAVLEEEIFYPAVRRHVGKDIMNEADEEHHVAKVLIAELDGRSGGGDHRDAKFKVLAESVRHHIREEENEMLPKAKEVDIDFEALGQRMLKRKQQLLKNGFPTDNEHAMVARMKGKTDSPVRAARKSKARSTGKAMAATSAGSSKPSSRRPSRRRTSLASR